MNIYQKLNNLQNQLKAPKSQYNSFGRYNYRNLEDILSAAKPILAEQKLLLFIQDDIVQVGDRYYIQATATIINSEKPEEQLVTKALARESASKKGMDESQITGAASSYARKYCLNGLFSIDDTRDADSIAPSNNTSYASQSHKQQQPPPQHWPTQPPPQHWAGVKSR